MVREVNTLVLYGVGAAMAEKGGTTVRNHYVHASQLLVGVLLTLLLAACGGGGDNDNGAAATTTTTTTAASDDRGSTEPTKGGSEATAVDACGLLTTEEVASALGGAAPEPKAENTAPLYACTWETADLHSVSVSVVVFDTPEQAKDVFDMAVDNNEYRVVDGIGDRAYEAVIYDITADRSRFEISVDVSVGDNDMDLAKSLVVKALDRLPA